MTETTRVFPMVGDQVLVRAGAFRAHHVGELIGIDPDTIYSHTVRFTDEEFSDFLDHSFKANELELIDATGSEVDGSGSVAMSAAVAGSPDDDASGAGAEAEPAAEEPPVETPAEPTELDRLEATVEREVERLLALLKGQHLTNIALHRAAANDLDLIGQAMALLARNEHTTTRRMRVNITKNTKGYNHDVTFEVTSSDPSLELQLEMERGLRDADRFARAAIDNAIYTDEHGVPGEDDKPF